MADDAHGTLALATIAILGAPGFAGPRDRIHAAEQFSNTVSVTDPTTNRLLGVIRLGEPQPTNFSPLYRGQVLVHGLGASPDHKLIAVVSIGSNAVTFIATETNAIRHTTYVGRSPHEATFTPDGAYKLAHAGDKEDSRTWQLTEPTLCRATRP